MKRVRKRKPKKQKWPWWAAKTQQSVLFPYFLELQLGLVLAFCSRRWMATAAANARVSMPPFSAINRKPHTLNSRFITPSSFSVSTTCTKINFADALFGRFNAILVDMLSHFQNFFARSFFFNPTKAKFNFCQGSLLTFLGVGKNAPFFIL